MLFRKKFALCPPEQVLRDRWASVKMDGNLEQYISAQVTAAARIPMVTEGEKIHHFICGLEDEIQTDVRRAQPKTLNEAIAAAYAADTLSRKRKMEANWASIPRKKSKLVTRQKPLKWSAAEFQKIRENKACFECGKQGHRKIDCPENKQVQSSCFAIMNENTLLKTDISFTDFDCGTQALVDSGATHNFISHEYVTTCGIPIQQIIKQPLMLANGTTSSCVGSVGLKFKLDGKVFEEKFMVANISHNCILGKPWLTNTNPTIDWTNNSLNLNHLSTPETQPLKPIMIISTLEMEEHLEGSDIYLINLNALQGKDDVKIPADLKPVLEEFKDVFPDDLPPGLPPSRFGKDFTIDLTPGAEPMVRPLRRLAPIELEELKTQLSDLISKGFIRPSNSNFGASILFVKKKDGTKRMCIDYRSLNEETVRDQYPLPLIDTLLDRVRGATVFSKLDLRSGYHQVRIDEPDIYKTAFRTPMGSFEYLVLPFGLTNAPSAFMRMMDSVFPDMEFAEFLAKYIDDILVFSKNMKEHVQHLRAVLTKLREHKLYVKLSKCAFGVNQVEFLGSIITKGGISVDPDKVKAILDIPIPTNLKQLRSFIGAVTFFSKFITHFAEKSQPLHALLRKSTPFIWTPTHTTSFELLKSALTQAPVLRVFDPDLTVILHTDASDMAIGGVLLQKDKKGERPVAYFSKTLSSAEINYTTQEKEMLAIIEALRKWRHYLLGRKFEAHTDHQSLQYVKTSKDPTHRLARWFEEIAEFDFDIVYRKGESNQLADELSRSTPTEPLEMEVDTISITSADPKFLDAIKAGYPTDSYFKPVFEYLIQNQPEQKQFKKRYGLFEAKDGFLYFKSGKRMCIPESSKNLRKTLLQEHHETPMAGHFAFEKTQISISEKYFWPRMDRSIQNFIRSCITCQKTKDTDSLTSGLLLPLDVPKRPWSSVALDFITGLPTTDSGFDAILTFVDSFSKMAHFVPCSSSTNAPQTAQLFLNQVFRYHGMPKSIVSDRGPQFTSDFWRSFFSLIGTKISLSTANHPQTDGQSERANQSIIALLRAFAEQFLHNWDKFLPILEFAFNNTLNSSTGYSPFQVNYGLSPLIPTDMISGTLISIDHEDINLILEKIETIHKIVKENLLVAKDKQAASSNKGRKEELFKKGDLVWLSSEHILPSTVVVTNSKLKPKFTGPYKVLKVINDNAYELDLPSSFQGHNVINVSYLKRHVKMDDDSSPPPPPEPTTEGEFEIDRILKMRIRYNRPEYLVRWKDATEAEDQWLTEKRLGNAKKLLTEFKATLKKGSS
jgi:hypothetical protein